MIDNSTTNRSPPIPPTQKEIDESIVEEFLRMAQAGEIPREDLQRMVRLMQQCGDSDSGGSRQGKGSQTETLSDDIESIAALAEHVHICTRDGESLTADALIVLREAAYNCLAASYKSSP